MAHHVEKLSERCELTAQQKFDVFFEQSRNGLYSEMALEGSDGLGQKLLDEELMFSVKLFCMAGKKESEVSCLAT